MPLSDADKQFFRDENDRLASNIEGHLAHLNGVQGNTGTGDLVHQLTVAIEQGAIGAAAVAADKAVKAASTPK